MTRIVTTHHRYKRPTRTKQAVPLPGPAVVTAKSGRRPVGEETAAAAQSASPGKENEAALSVARLPSNDDGKPAPNKPAIVTTTSRKRAASDAPRLPMELPLSRKPIERDGDDYKRLKAAMTRRLRGDDE